MSSIAKEKEKVLSLRFAMEIRDSGQIGSHTGKPVLSEH